MPHFGLMNEEALGPVEGPLRRARLHIRGGKRRLRQGKISAGIVTLYDALDGAMLWYFAGPGGKAGITVPAGKDGNDDRAMFLALVKAGVLDGAFDFDAFDRLVEHALNEELPGYDYQPVLSGIEEVMARLGVMPFDEEALPPEDPATF
ncbi:MAG: hypothetical protein M0042_08385 [Nitrospiraceae bacterium]|nr:hypothetical protein [Nitrospiraceae bacterium]